MRDKKMEAEILEAVCGFLNADGGTLLVGVANDGTIVGIELDGFPDKDKYVLHFVNLVKDRIGNDVLAQLRKKYPISLHIITDLEQGLAA